MKNFDLSINEISKELVGGYRARKNRGIISDVVLPDKDMVIAVVEGLRNVLFPEIRSFKNKSITLLETEIKALLHSIRFDLINQITLALNAFGGAKKNAEELCEEFLSKLPEIQSFLNEDIDAFFENDPAAENKAQIVLTYPGFFAITVYRIANSLHNLGVPVIPRMMTEYAHGLTGVDIHPGATIGKKFFIDHGTGVVIGETTIIGNSVRIYQGVTLGGLSIKDRETTLNKKRHPTIKNNVTIYANATVLGGKTVIGENTIIGGGTFVTDSIPDNIVLSMELPKFQTKERKTKV